MKRAGALSPLAARLPVGLLVGFGIGLVLLALGIGALFGIIIDERDLALAAIDQTQVEVGQRATQRLKGDLEHALEGVEAAVDAALASPFVASDDLLLSEEGLQLLPRRIGHAAASEAIATFTALTAGVADATRDPLLAERLALVARLPASYDAWQQHRRDYRIRIDLELASTLYAMMRLQAAGELFPARAEELFRGPSLGFFTRLLDRRNDLTRSDFDGLLARALPIATPLVRVDDVRARARAKDIALPPAFLRPYEVTRTERELAVADGWVGWVGPRDCIGRRVDLPALVATIGRDVGGVELSLLPGVVPSLTASSPAWDAARTAADERLLLKAIPLGVVALLALAVCALALLLQRRRAAYIELRGKLLAAVTHELKTPLASIRAMAETLELRLGDHPGARDYPRRIVASSERLELMVDNVLSFARLERDAWKPRIAPLAVSDLAAWLAADPVARAVRPVDFTADIAADLTLSADPDLVRLMLSNLLDNAAKYATADRVKVSFSGHIDDGGTHLAISDDGPGLGALDPRTLFADFQRGDVQGVHGTGLGLSICKMVMALHGGTIDVASSPAGTTFTAHFPHLSPTGERAAKGHAAPKAVPS